MLLNSKYPLLVVRCIPYLADQAKNSVIDKFIAYNRNLNSGGRKEMMKIATQFVAVGDIRALNILETFLRIFDKPNINLLLSKIPQGINNQSVQEIMAKTKTLEYLTFDEQKFNTDLAERERMIKAIAKTPTLIKKLSFDMKTTLEDIKKIPPAMRFNFLQVIFAAEKEYIRWHMPCNNHRGTSLKAYINGCKKKEKLDHFIMPEISYDEMKELLFAVCLKKNDSVSKWIEVYNKYLQLIQASGEK